MKYLKSKAKKIDFYKYPWNKMVMGYWWVPCHMIEKQSKIKDFDVFVPENWKEYLSYRYYDWTKKVDNWKYWCDDGGIVNKSPVSLLQKSR